MIQLDHESAVHDSVDFLNSDEARRSIESDIYWPKWNSPWWHMSALYEMGLADRIPQTASAHMADRLKLQLVPFFFQCDVPEGKDPKFDTPCPCSLGNIFQILSAAGVNMDRVLPWARAWFLRYQMPDGGLSCDEDAYKARPSASSVVATIAPLEAILYFTPRAFTPEEEQFLDRGARCLIERKLMLGSSTDFNAEERLDENDWLKPCFPRFYLYDVLRGLVFILRWAEKRNQSIPLSAITGVVTHLHEKFPSGKIQTERHSYEAIGTRLKNPKGAWVRRETATSFPLLEKISEIGGISPYLTRHWDEAQKIMNDLSLRGLLQ